MSSKKSLDIAPLLTKPFSDLIETLETADDASLIIVTSLLLDMTIQLLRHGTEAELLAASTSLHKYLERGSGQAWRIEAPERYGTWTAIARLLSEGARK